MQRRIIIGLVAAAVVACLGIVALRNGEGASETAAATTTTTAAKPEATSTTAERTTTTAEVATVAPATTVVATAPPRSSQPVTTQPPVTSPPATSPPLDGGTNGPPPKPDYNGTIPADICAPGGTGIYRIPGTAHSVARGAGPFLIGRGLDASHNPTESWYLESDWTTCRYWTTTVPA